MGKDCDGLEKANTRNGDIYCLFYQQANKLLKEKGFLTYINSKTWMRSEYGSLLIKETFSTQYVTSSRKCNKVCYVPGRYK